MTKSHSKENKKETGGREGGGREDWALRDNRVVIGRSKLDYVANRIKTIALLVIYVVYSICNLVICAWRTLERRKLDKTRKKESNWRLIRSRITSGHVGANELVNAIRVNYRFVVFLSLFSSHSSH